MKKEIGISVLVLLGFLTILWLEKPLREFIASNYFDEVVAKRISGIFIRLILIIFALTAIKKLKLQAFSAIYSLKKTKNLHAMVLPALVISMGFVNNWNTYLSSKIEVLLVFTISIIIIGIVEELVFRGIIFPLFIKALQKLKYPLVISAILSSLMFGAVHFVNLFEQPENFLGITSQVFFALSIGVFFCGIMVRTENIIIPIILHAFVNFSFGAGELKEFVEKSNNIAKTAVINWNSVIPTTIFFAFILASGIFMILKSNRNEILAKLNLS